MAYTKKSVEERIAVIDKKIESCKQRIESDRKKIDELTAKKDRILNPQSHKEVDAAVAIINKAKAAGLTESEIAEKLGIEL